MQKFQITISTVFSRFQEFQYFLYKKEEFFLQNEITHSFFSAGFFFFKLLLFLWFDGGKYWDL